MTVWNPWQNLYVGNGPNLTARTTAEEAGAGMPRFLADLPTAPRCWGRLFRPYAAASALRG